MWWQEKIAFTHALNCFNHFLKEQHLWSSGWALSVNFQHYWTTQTQRMTLHQGYCFCSQMLYRNVAFDEPAVIGLNLLFHSGLWCECSAGPDSRTKEHLHRHALLDGSRGHRLWWKPRCYLWLQGKDRHWICSLILITDSTYHGECYKMHTIQVKKGKTF